MFPSFPRSVLFCCTCVGSVGCVAKSVELNLGRGRGSSGCKGEGGWEERVVQVVLSSAREAEEDLTLSHLFPSVRNPSLSLSNRHNQING